MDLISGHPASPQKIPWSTQVQAKFPVSRHKTGDMQHLCVAPAICLMNCRPQITSVWVSQPRRDHMVWNTDASDLGSLSQSKESSLLHIDAGMVSSILKDACLCAEPALCDSD